MKNSLKMDKDVVVKLDQTQKIKMLDWHRKFNELGGILLGTGLGVFIGGFFYNTPIVAFSIAFVCGLVGYLMLRNEQNKWIQYRNNGF